ncbi:MAG: ubiquinol-cytochrome c reductase iron-sulfur subunit [Chloroflexota bacterium]
MATATKGQGAIVEKAQRKEVAVEVAGPSRREFLYYIWGASVVMLLGQATAGIVWFALPRFKEGEFGGVFPFSGEDIPEAGTPPAEIPEGRLWLSNTSEGFLALYAVCTHLGCLPGWNENNFRFECPCHGSKFEIDGAYIEGPAPRGLDRFNAVITFTDGTTAITPADGSPIPLNGREIADIRVDTSARTNGPPPGA